MKKSFIHWKTGQHCKTPTPTNLETCSLIRLTSSGCELPLLLEVPDLNFYLRAAATHGIYNAL